MSGRGRGEENPVGEFLTGEFLTKNYVGEFFSGEFLTENPVGEILTEKPFQKEIF